MLRRIAKNLIDSKAVCVDLKNCLNAELMGTMKKLHEAFVLLVGRVHTIHSALQNYKDDYLTYRRRVLGDSTDIFANKTGAGTTLTMVSHLNKIASGPSPFGGIHFISSLKSSLQHEFHRVFVDKTNIDNSMFSLEHFYSFDFIRKF